MTAACAVAFDQADAAERPFVGPILPETCEGVPTP